MDYRLADQADHFLYPFKNCRKTKAITNFVMAFKIDRGFGINGRQCNEVFHKSKTACFFFVC